MAWKKIVVSGSTAELASINVDGAIVASSITGSADFTSLANKPSLVSGSEQIVTSLVNQDLNLGTGAITASYFKGDGSGLENLTVAQTATIVRDFTNVTTYTVTHNFGSKNVLVTVYDANDYQIFPASIQANSDNTAIITFDTPTSGTVIVGKGGHIVSGSIEFSSILNAPSLVSSSAQVEELFNVTNISASIAAEIAALEVFSSSLGSTYATDAELSNVSASLAAEIAALDGSYATDAELNASSSTLQGNIDGVQSNLDSVSSSLAADITALGNTYATDAELNASSSTLQSNIDGVQSNLDSVSSSLASSISTEKGRVDAILLAADADKDSFAEIVTLINSVDTANDAAFAAYYTSSNGRLNALELESASVDGRVTSLESAVSALDGTYATDAELNASSSDLQTNIDGVQSNLDSVSSSLAAEIAALDGAYATDAELNASSSALQSNIDGVQSNLDNVSSSLEGHINTVTSNLSSASSSLASSITTEKGRVDAILLAADADKDSFAEIVTLINTVDLANDQAFAAYYTSSNGRLNALELESASVDGRVTSLESAVSALDGTYATDAELNASSSALQSNIDGVQSNLDSVSSSLAADITALGNTYATDAELNASSSTLQSNIDGVQSNLDSVSSSLAAGVAANASAIAALDGTYATDAELNASSSTLQSNLNSVSSSFANTINGLSSTIKISGSAGSDTVNLVDDDLRIIGALAQINTTVTNNQVEISIAQNPILPGNVTVTGNLTVQGDTFQAQVTNINVEDRFILLNSGSVSGDAGIIFGGSDGGLNVGSGIFWDSPANVFGFSQGISAEDTTATHSSKLGNIQVAASAPSTAPTFQGVGTVHIDSSDEGIWVYS